jgi:hypothetical protein
MIACVIILALLTLLVAIEPEPDESSFPSFHADRNHPRR